MARGSVKGKMKAWRKEAQKINEAVSEKIGERVRHQGRRYKMEHWMQPPQFPSELVMGMFQRAGLVVKKEEKNEDQ